MLVIRLVVVVVVVVIVVVSGCLLAAAWVLGVLFVTLVVPGVDVNG